MSSNDMLGKSALAEVAGPLKDFLEKLGGTDGQQWLSTFKRFLRKESCWGIGVFPTWRTIKLGTHETMDALQRALTDNGYHISNWAGDILKKVTVCPIEVDVDLVVVSVADLGFLNGATRKDVYERAAELDLKLCPAEVGLELRLQYEDQPEGEWLLVAMEPITDSHGFLDVFNVSRDRDGRWLKAICGRPDNFWNGPYRWVFLRRK